MSSRRIAVIEAWFTSPSQAGKHRGYSASDVALHRDAGELTVDNTMARRLRHLLAEHTKAGTCITSLGVVDSTSLHAATEEGLVCAYVSGAALSFADVGRTDPSADLSDYLPSAVADKVNSMYRAQLARDRLNRGLAQRGFKCTDPMIPLIADCDSGYGLHTSVMKAVKLLVEAGTAGLHIDDMLSGSKRFDKVDGVGGVLVPLSEHKRRLVAAQLQLDIMGSECVLINRTDAIHSTHITSTIDPADRAFILGSPIPSLPSYASLRTSAERTAWRAAAQLCSIDEATARAAEAAGDLDLLQKYNAQVGSLCAGDAKRLALRLGIKVEWDCDIARTYQGWYPYRGCIESSLDRMKRTSHLFDVVWYCAISYLASEAEFFAKELQAASPGKWMMFNTTQASRARVKDIPPAELERIPHTLGRLGYSLNIMPLAGQVIHALGSARGSKAVLQGGLAAFIEEIAGPAEDEAEGRPLVAQWHPNFGSIADSVMDIIGTGE